MPKYPPPLKKTLVFVLLSLIVVLTLFSITTSVFVIRTDTLFSMPEGTRFHPHLRHHRKYHP